MGSIPTLKRIIILALLICYVAVPVEAGLFPVELKDDTGTIVWISRRPRRIVSLAPNMTEILYAVGQGDRIVGVTEYCDYPAQARKKTKIGGIQIQNERIWMLRPDLVVAHAGMQKQTVAQLRRLNLPVLALDPKDWNGLLLTIEKIGRATGSEAHATSIIQEMESRRERVETATAGARKVRLFVEVWNKPLMTAGPGTFLHELTDMAGGLDIAADALTPWSAFPEEKVLVRDPEVIILTCKNRQEVLNRGAWRRITAVRRGRVYEVDPDLYSRPGPRLVEALEDLASLLESVRGEGHH